MNFVKENYKALLLVLFAMLSEVIILPFSKIEHSVINNVSYSYGDALYYFTTQIGYVSFLPALFLYWNESKIESKGIYLGLVVWNTLEVLQEVNCLFKLNIQLLIKTSSYSADCMQIIFIIFVVLFTYKAYVKCHT